MKLFINLLRSLNLADLAPREISSRSSVAPELKCGRQSALSRILKSDLLTYLSYVTRFYDQAHPIMSNISIDAMVPLNGASVRASLLCTSLLAHDCSLQAIVAASNVNDDAQQFVIIVLS